MEYVTVITVSVQVFDAKLFKPDSGKQLRVFCLSRDLWKMYNLNSMLNTKDNNIRFPIFDNN